MKKQTELDILISSLIAEGKRPSLLLQSCCGPCSSYVIEYLASAFDITVLYYNPNIYPEAEYEKRLREQIRLIEEAPFAESVKLLPCDYDGPAFFSAASGLESEREGGARCDVCFRLRLEETAKRARELGFDYFGTTLSVSPHKNASLLRKIGDELGEKYGVKHLPADFKKRGGYQRSIALSREFDLYRQNYCGCKFSMPQSEN